MRQYDNDSGRELIVTADGSHSVAIPALEVTYHSKHGAVQESVHVFVEAGLKTYVEENEADTGGDTVIRIFEMGFGTGLNALLALQFAMLHKIRIHYSSVETFPLPENFIGKLNYEDPAKLFLLLHAAAWNEEVVINDYFILQKLSVQLQEVHVPCDIVFFDAFGPATQPELWSEDIFRSIYKMMNPGAILTTYCSKSIVRKNMAAAGFIVEKLQGPPGKREMVRARKATNSE